MRVAMFNLHIYDRNFDILYLLAMLS